MSLTPPVINHIEDYWFDNNPALTHFMNTLSSLFEKGEGFFMHSITPFLKTHPEFKDQIVKFVREERAHSKLHVDMNSRFKNRKLLKKLEQRTGNIINLFTKPLSKKQRLAATAALEHVTCCLALQLLKRKDIQAKMFTDVKEAWLYHALEESSESHRTLAFNIYNKLGNNNVERYALMAFATFILSCVVTIYWFEIMANDSFEGFFEAISILLHPTTGLIIGIIPEYLTWFNSNYTP